ncbi:glycosyltransferase family 2 protein [Candidatus Woesearchaeota archaeon]|nr:glycosyltransferase family 2 protein [Candidatus Woesearchaeota archaeon]
MWKGKTVSLVFPAYNEEEGIKKSIDDFSSTGVIDEIVVVNNNSTDGTVEEAKKTNARIVNEYNKGYGHAVQRGLREAAGDYIIMSEPEGTFVGKDAIKLLTYMDDDFDAVFGTRTSKELIWSGAKMSWFWRLGNWFLGKVIEYLFNGPCLTDAGGGMKLFKKETIRKIQDKFTVGGSHFGPEIMILLIKNKFKVVEIPINYRERLGRSKISGYFWKALILGFQNLYLIFKYRLGLVRPKKFR